jgi:D-serine deaminase-like pyridoxal phosphate-dependent protein
MRISELDTPALLVDLERLERNIRDMADYCAGHGLSLRPHIKTHKNPAIAKMQIRAGACGITVAKPGEAAVMAAEGLDDILIAYPVVGSSKLERLVSLARDVRITVALDSLEVAQGISAAAVSAGVTIRVLAELDAGLRRCGVQGVDALVDLSRGIARLPGLEFLGFMFFPGHVAVPAAEQPPMLDAIDAQLQAAQEQLFKEGIPIKVVSGGSTPTARQCHRMKTVTEIRPGTYVFNDMNTVATGTTDLDHCALTIMATVVSTSVRGRAVIDAGSKTFASDAPRNKTIHGFGFVVGHPDVVLEGMSEEHGHLNIAGSCHSFRIGERVRVIPNHVCTAVNLHNEVWGVRGDEVVEHWTVAARGLVR